VSSNLEKKKKKTLHKKGRQSDSTSTPLIQAPVLQKSKRKKNKKVHTNKSAQLLGRREAVAIPPIPYMQKTPQVNKNLFSNRKNQMCLVFPLYFISYLNCHEVHSHKINPLNENANNFLVKRLKWYSKFETDFKPQYKKKKKKI
jgi:hypothetical protein